MTIRGAERVVRQARLVLEENLQERLDAVQANAADGLVIQLPRIGMPPDGDYFERDAGPKDIRHYPAFAIWVTGTRPAPGNDANVLAQLHELRVRYWDIATDQRLDNLVRRIWRVAAAVKDLIHYRHTRLDTIEVPDGVASASLWRSDNFPEVTGAQRSGDVAFDVQVHERKD